jgi:hypothetical protein
MLTLGARHRGHFAANLDPLRGSSHKKLNPHEPIYWVNTDAVRPQRQDKGLWREAVHGCALGVGPWACSGDGRSGASRVRYTEEEYGKGSTGIPRALWRFGRRGAVQQMQAGAVLRPRVSGARVGARVNTQTVRSWQLLRTRCALRPNQP